MSISYVLPTKTFPTARLKQTPEEIYKLCQAFCKTYHIEYIPNDKKVAKKLKLSSQQITEIVEVFFHYVCLSGRTVYSNYFPGNLKVLSEYLSNAPCPFPHIERRVGRFTIKDKCHVDKDTTRKNIESNTKPSKIKKKP